MASSVRPPVMYRPSATRHRQMVRASALPTGGDVVAAVAAEEGGAALGNDGTNTRAVDRCGPMAVDAPLDEPWKGHGTQLSGNDG
jgi:hypothetical protein